MRDRNYKWSSSKPRPCITISSWKVLFRLISKLTKIQFRNHAMLKKQYLEIIREDLVTEKHKIVEVIWKTISSITDIIISMPFHKGQLKHDLRAHFTSIYLKIQPKYAFKCLNSSLPCVNANRLLTIPEQELILLLQGLQSSSESLNAYKLSKPCEPPREQLPTMRNDRSSLRAFPFTTASHTFDYIIKGALLIFSFVTGINLHE